MTDSPQSEVPAVGSDENAMRAFDDGSWLRLGRYCAACARWVDKSDSAHLSIELPARLWIYTNYDCNLQCAYCLVSSNPYAERRALGLDRFRTLFNEARQLGVRELFLTGGEPLLLDEIFEMISLATPHVRTTLLTNALLARGRRLEKLLAVNHANLFIQVSVDDDQPGLHDKYRGEGTWQRTVDAMDALRAAGFQLRVASTVTPELAPKVVALRRFVRDRLQIGEADHIVRPLLRRGFSEEGMAVGKADLVPELTVDASGIFWHPAGTDSDLLVSADTGSLKRALEEVTRISLARTASPLQPFR